MSIVLNIEEIRAKVKKRGYKYAAIYSGHKNNETEELNRFEKLNCESNEILLQELDEFAICYKHKFTIQFAENENAGKERRDIVMVDFSGARKQEFQQTHIDATEIRNSILKELRAEAEAKAKEDEIKELKQELKQFKTQGGKFGYSMHNFFSHLIGAEEGKRMALQGTQNNTKNRNMPKLNDLEQAFDKLIDLLGEETIINLANKIEEGDPIITTVKAFANNGQEKTTKKENRSSQKNEGGYSLRRR